MSASKDNASKDNGGSLVATYRSGGPEDPVLLPSAPEKSRYAHGAASLGCLATPHMAEASECRFFDSRLTGSVYSILYLVLAPHAPIPDSGCLARMAWGAKVEPSF